MSTPAVRDAHRELEALTTDLTEHVRAFCQQIRHVETEDHRRRDTAAAATSAWPAGAHVARPATAHEHTPTGSPDLRRGDVCNPTRTAKTHPPMRRTGTPSRHNRQTGEMRSGRPDYGRPERTQTGWKH